MGALLREAVKRDLKWAVNVCGAGTASSRSKDGSASPVKGGISPRAPSLPFLDQTHIFPGKKGRSREEDLPAHGAAPSKAVRVNGLYHGGPRAGQGKPGSGANEGSPSGPF